MYQIRFFQKTAFSIAMEQLKSIRFFFSFIERIVVGIYIFKLSMHWGYLINGKREK